MSKENADNGSSDAQKNLKLADVDFPGQINDQPKSESSSGAYNIYIPSASEFGQPEEYEKVLALVADLNALADIGSVTRISLGDAFWSIHFNFKGPGKLTNAVLKVAFAALNPVLQSADAVMSGFVQDKPPFWKLMEGTKVLTKGNFIKAA